MSAYKFMEKILHTYITDSFVHFSAIFFFNAIHNVDDEVIFKELKIHV